MSEFNQRRELSQEWFFLKDRKSKYWKLKSRVSRKLAVVVVVSNRSRASGLVQKGCHAVLLIPFRDSSLFFPECLLANHAPLFLGRQCLFYLQCQHVPQTDSRLTEPQRNFLPSSSFFLLTLLVRYKVSRICLL